MRSSFLKQQGQEKVKIEAQTYAKSLYEKQGFVTVSEPFLEDGIEHVAMILDLTE